MKHFGFAIVTALGATVCGAQYRIVPGDSDADGCAGNRPARICEGASDSAHCYSPMKEKDYVFGLEPKSERVGNLEGEPLTLFTAMSSGCGSGTLTDFSLLAIRDGEFVNLLPAVRLTNQSEYKFWNLPQVSKLPVLVTADFVWDFKAKETHFAAHRYRIAAYVFDSGASRYSPRVSYVTKKKYSGLDERDRISVLGPEKPEILAKLGRSGQ